MLFDKCNVSIKLNLICYLIVVYNANGVMRVGCSMRVICSIFIVHVVFKIVYATVSTEMKKIILAFTVRALLTKLSR